MSGELKDKYVIVMLSNGMNIMTEERKDDDGTLVWVNPQLLIVKGNPATTQDLGIAFMPFLTFSTDLTCECPNDSQIITRYVPNQDLLVEFHGYMLEYETKRSATEAGIVLPSETNLKVN